MAKILLVEDDNNLREIYEARLQAEGYEIVTAPDGESALVVAKKELPDLVISDVMMPRVSGFEMLDILRNTEGLKHVKVIMLTALGQAEDKTRADSLGADKYLVKSQVTLEDIVKAASELLGGEAPTPAAPATAAAETTELAEPTAVAPAPAAATDTAPAPAAPAASQPPAAPDPAPATPPAATAAPSAPAPPTAEQPAAEPSAPADPSPTPPASSQPMFAPGVPAMPAARQATQPTPASATPTPQVATAPDPAAPAAASPAAPSSAPSAPAMPADPPAATAPVSGAPDMTPSAAPNAASPIPAQNNANATDSQVVTSAVNDLVQSTLGSSAPAGQAPAAAPAPAASASPTSAFGAAPATPTPAAPSPAADNTDSRTKKVIQPLESGNTQAPTDLNELMAKEGHVLDTVAPQTNPLPNQPGAVISPNANTANPAAQTPNLSPADHDRIAL